MHIPDKSFLAIVGLGGIGKTTLAMELYRKVGDEFDCRASVQASQKFNLLALPRSLVKQFHEQIAPIDGIEEWGEKRLNDKLVDQLKGKRYLILIDDICTVSTWRNIYDCLPNSIKGGTVVVTTRSKSVAIACCHQNGYLYEHKPLGHAESYHLFRQFIEHATEDPTETATELLQKCGGLPLAIIVMTGLVAGKVSWDLWKKLDQHTCHVDNIMSAYLGLTHVNTDGVKLLLDGCYNDLPGELKTCLLYMSIFPNGRFISRKRLIRKWVAEGFLCETRGKTVEEVAKHCFNELLLRDFIRAVTFSSNGKVKSCQIHNLVHEYIVSKSSQENFITIVGGWFQALDPQVLGMHRIRCLSVHTSAREEKKTLKKMKLSNVRSLTAFGSTRVDNIFHLSAIIQASMTDKGTSVLPSWNVPLAIRIKNVLTATLMFPY